MNISLEDRGRERGERKRRRGGERKKDEKGREKEVQSFFLLHLFNSLIDRNLFRRSEEENHFNWIHSAFFLLSLSFSFFLSLSLLLFLSVLTLFTLSPACKSISFLILYLSFCLSLSLFSISLILSLPFQMTSS